MKQDDLTYRWAEPGDLPAYEAFISETYGPDAVQAVPGRAKWLYWDNPLGLHVALCLDESRIVGACGHLPYPVEINGRPVDAAFGLDMMVARSMRRRGIARRLLQMRLERFELSLSSGQSDGMAALYGTVGSIDLGAVTEARWRRRFPGPRSPRRLLGDLAAWAKPRTKRGIDSPRREALDVDEAADRATRLLSDPVPSADTRRWRDWIGWRYGGPVYRDYQAWRVRTGDGAEGITMTRSGGDREIVVHCFAPRESCDRILAASAQTSEAEVVTVLCAGHHVVRAASMAGYLIRPRAGRFVSVRGAVRNERSAEVPEVNLWAGASDSDLLRLPS